MFSFYAFERFSTFGVRSPYAYTGSNFVVNLNLFCFSRGRKTFLIDGSLSNSSNKIYQCTLYSLFTGTDLPNVMILQYVFISHFTFNFTIYFMSKLP